MRQFIVHQLLALAIVGIAAPNVASAGAVGCARTDRRLTELTLVVALGATGGALMFRRRRINWGEGPRDR